MRRSTMWVGGLAVLLVAGLACAGETAKKPKGEAPKKPEAEAPKPAEQPKPDDQPDDVGGNAADMVAKVDHTTITRGELNQARRLIASGRRGPLPNNQQILEQLINRALWQRYFDREGLRPSGAEIQQAIAAFDQELRRRGASYQRYLIARALTAEEDAALRGYNLAMQRLVSKIQEKITEQDIQAEYDAHPEWYDGSRIRIQQIFIDTSNLGSDKRKLDEAKQRIEKVQAQLTDGKDFDRLAKDYSEGAAGGRGGDRGWFRRKGPEVDEPLISAAWMLKVGEITKPIRGVRGWHILKVTEREPASFTFFGCKKRIEAELTRRRLEAVLDELKAAAKIERLL
jgi:foldase protein PrsA